MAEIDFNEIDLDDPNAGSQLRKFAQQAGAQAAKATELEAQAAQQAREIAALRAGVDTSTRQGAAWLATTTVDFKDPAAVLADAQEFGAPIKGTPAPPAPAPAPTLNADGTPVVLNADGTPQAPAPVETGTDQRNALNNGAVNLGDVSEDPVTASHRVAQEAIKQGAPVMEALGAAIGMQAAALAEGKLQTA